MKKSGDYPPGKHIFFEPLSSRDLSGKSAGAMASVHQRCTPEGWSSASFADGLRARGSLAFGVFSSSQNHACDAKELLGFILLRTVLDEAELLMLAVLPERQRAGLGRLLCSHAFAALAQANVRHVFLEVNVENKPALALYHQLGFQTFGKRKAYYQAPKEGQTADGLRMTLKIRPEEKTVTALDE